jgi:cytochrome c oxidase subunit 4
MAYETHESTTEHSDSHNHGVGHVVPIKLLVAVGMALLVLTWITVAAMKIDLGDGNIYLALGIAVVKASLVALFFMHLRWDRPFNAFVFVTSIAFVALFIAFALTDSSEYRPEQNQYRMIELQGGDASLPQQKLAETMQQ